MNTQQFYATLRRQVLARGGTSGGGGMTGLTGDVEAGPGTGSQAATIPNDTVTNAKLANMGQATVKGRAAGAVTGDPVDLTPAQLAAILIQDSEYDAGNSGTSKTIDWANGRQQKLSLTGNVTLTFTNGVNGVAYRLILVQDGTGGRTITWPSSVKFENNTAPVLGTTLNTVWFGTFVKTSIGAGTGYLGFVTVNPITQP